MDYANIIWIIASGYSYEQCVHMLTVNEREVFDSVLGSN